jgi:CRP-like cAMP-binding protein
MTSIPAWWPDKLSDTQPAEGGIWAVLKSRLDIQQYKPAQAPDVIFKELTDASGRHFMLKNPRAHTYVRLSPEEFWVWQRLDGEHTVQRLVVAYFMEFGSFAFGAIVGMLEHLRNSSMLSQPPAHLYSEVSEALHKQGLLQGLAGLGRAALATEFTIKGLDGHLDRIYRRGGWLLYTRPVQAIFLIVSVVGLYFFARLAADPELQLLRWGSAVQLALLAYIPIVIHEFGHALTAKHVGCEVHRGGAMLFYGLPAAFVETTDLWMFGKRERLMVTWAGPYTGYILGGACAIVVFLFPGIPDGVTTALLQIAFVGILTTTVNLLPVLKLDGYYMLSDVLAIPRLRERSLEFLSRSLPDVLKTRERWRREETIFLVFGVLVIVSTVFFTYASIEFWDRQTSTSVSELLNMRAGPLARIRNALVALLGASILAYSLTVLVRGAGRAIGWARRKGLFGTRGRAAFLMVVVALALTFLPALALPILSRWLVVLAGLGAFGAAAWLALATFGEMRGSVHARMWLVAASAYTLGALAFAAKIVVRRMDAGLAFSAAGIILSILALLAAGRLLRGIRGSWRSGSLGLVVLGIVVWTLGLVTRTPIQTLGGLLVLGGLIHWRMRPPTLAGVCAVSAARSTRARMSGAVKVIRTTILDELELDFGRQTRLWVEARAYGAKKRDVGRAEFANTVPGMTPDDYGGSMALSLEGMLQNVARAAGRRYAHRALALGFDRLDWELQEIAEDHVLKYVHEAEGLSTALAQTRDDLSQLIRSVPLFVGLTGIEIRALSREFKSQLFKRGETIAGAGDAGDNFYLIRAGRAQILSSDGQILDRLSRGDCFGESTLLAQEEVQVTLRAVTPVEVLRLGRHQFDRLIGRSASFDAAAGEAFERLRVLRRIPLFAPFDCRDLTRLAGKLEEVNVQARDLVFSQGDDGDSFYILKSGKVSVQIDSVERATLGAGEYFGEIALMMDTPRTATIVAVRPSVLLRMQAQDFTAMLQDSGAMQSAMQRASSRRVLSNERWMREAQTVA